MCRGLNQTNMLLTEMLSSPLSLHKTNNERVLALTLTLTAGCLLASLVLTDPL